MRRGNTVEDVLVRIDDPILRVPQLAIHLDRTANEALKLDRQAHTQPILAVTGVGLFYVAWLALI